MRQGWRGEGEEQREIKIRKEMVKEGRRREGAEGALDLEEVYRTQQHTMGNQTGKTLYGFGSAIHEG